jgi:Na+/H+ antiporter NhaC
MNFLPAIVFLIACFLSFATGTSWGTFGILIPIVIDVFALSSGTLSIISISACMAGAVCGDHCSPISDTTIMSSAGAQCNHVNHVSTQLPYSISVASISFISYLLSGLLLTMGMNNPIWVALPLGIVLVVLYVVVMGRNAQRKIAA